VVALVAPARLKLPVCPVAFGVGFVELGNLLTLEFLLLMEFTLECLLDNINL
jgi:hypothetical protein